MYLPCYFRRHFERPDVQRRVLAILWMVPIYSVTSWLQLVRTCVWNVLLNAIPFASFAEDSLLSTTSTRVFIYILLTDKPSLQVFPSSTDILSGIRDCYEAYVVYTFFAFLIAVLANTNFRATSGSIGNVHNVVVKLLAQRIKDQREEQALKGKIESYYVCTCLQDKTSPVLA